MKTASIPSLRVDPQLRQDVESVLMEGENLSAFVAQAIRASVARRRLHREFIARGLASRKEARHSGEYYPADSVHAELDAMLREAAG